MSTMIARAEAVAGGVIGPLFREMNRTGQAGHCIYVARVLELVLSELGVPSAPLCVDYEFANAAAVQQMDQGLDLVAPAVLATTGSDGYDGYPHHVITLVADAETALLLDPTIIQIQRHMPEISMPPVLVTLPWPRTSPLTIDVGGGRLTYSFRTGQTDFMDNDQWADLEDAKERAAAVLRMVDL